MTYQGANGEVTALFAPAASQDKGGGLDVVASGSLTGGKFGLFRYDPAAGAPGPAARFHRTFSESFYVLDGKVCLFDGDRWTVATVGDFLFGPQGGIHAFGNSADTHSSLLILFAPGIPRERYVSELAEITKSGRQLSGRDWTEFYAPHDQFSLVACVWGRAPPISDRRRRTAELSC
jgi:mannose-6-phosphate isomerase-like protein (cupin superfamily)